MLQLLTDALSGSNHEDPVAREETRQRVLSLLDTEVQLRSKRELIERFIKEYWDGLEPGADIVSIFRDYWNNQRHDHLEQMCAEEKLEIEGVEYLIGQYRFSNRFPLGRDIIDIMESPPSILERRRRIDRASQQIMNAIEVFEEV